MGFDAEEYEIFKKKERNLSDIASVSCQKVALFWRMISMVLELLEKKGKV